MRATSFKMLMTSLLKMRRAGSLAVVGLLTISSCSDGTSGTDSVPPETVAVQAVLLEQTAAWISTAYDGFGGAADRLVEATATYAMTLDDADRVAARDAWFEAIDAWQHAELALLGPAAAMGAAVGGEDLRDAIYSWPVVNPCRVDQETAARGFDALGESPVNVRGLDALEYLLFVVDFENSCEPNSAINSDGVWAELTEAQITERRADYAAAAALDLQATSSSLGIAWAEFTPELETAGDTSTVFPRQRDAINAISDALFYIDTDVKDMKVAEPAGLSECAEATCPEQLESQFAKASAAHVRANVEAFLELFGDDESAGFYALLAHHGAEALGADIVSATDDALEVIDGLDATFAALLESEPERVVEVYDAIKVITDLLKTEFLSILDLDLPDRAAGDND
jgi:predicted lipoprotein